ncbi:MAG: histidine kinase [Amycolatopsis sp.]|uniref:sensor histidine kinase n=1 Tax=Amycolatopsis sp. TaxID=37632 RepID=UPI0026066DD3|nr:ATP-binding protein [Amycolatopsis sp.]MCU1682902.1 histidine kinase [Amycolatopsis sp.]
MATRARELLDRSRVLLDRSRIAAAHFLAQPAVPVQAPRIIEAAPSAPRSTGGEDALVGICSSVALRDLNLVDSLLAQLEEMEAKEQDQERLGELYRLDHLATRLRRNAENLRVLVGRDAGEAASETSSLVDVMRAAMSSIDHYSRITIGRVVSLGVVGFAAEDLSRLLAELFDNAANQSSPNSAVGVSAHLTEQGSVLLRIEDEGIGIPSARLADLNKSIENAPPLDSDSARHMGLAVVGRLADRHGMTVRLERRTPRGTIATVLLPTGLVSELPEPAWSGSQTVVFPRANGASSGVSPLASAAASPQGRQATVTGLPLRSRSVAEKPSPRPRPEPRSDGVTAGGLPRRVSHSIKGSTAGPPLFADSNGSGDGFGGGFSEDGHDQLIADLGAFTDGEQAARDELRRHAEGETPEGSQ